MKKRILIFMFLLGIATICLVKGNRSLAQNSPINGQGNLIMETDAIGFYGEDIQYLKTEIDKLKSECY